MQKLMKNWVFTMITCILLWMFAVLMFLDGFDVGGLHIGDRLTHLLAAIALAVYAVFALFPLVVRYRGILRGFVCGEVVILLVTAFAHLLVEWISIPLISSLEVCSVLGLALWLRGVVENVHAYLSGGSTDPEKRVPLWKLLLYILLSAVGVWQLVSPSISDKTFIFVIGILAAIMGSIFAGITFSNRKATAPERAVKKQKRLEQKAAKLKEKAEKEAAEKEAEEKKKEEEPALLAEKSEEGKE
jgi:glucan phosphoethanolaminetransferase (alkaline phosphatase superfamily)